MRTSILTISNTAAPTLRRPIFSLCWFVVEVLGLALVLTSNPSPLKKAILDCFINVGFMFMFILMSVFTISLRCSPTRVVVF